MRDGVQKAIAVIKRQAGLYSCTYVKKIRGQDCYCVLGALAIEAGVDRSVLAANIDTPIATVPEIHEAITRHFGLSLDVQNKLQNRNDSCNESPTARKQRAIKYLEFLGG